jgi:hypothetical protein
LENITADKTQDFIGAMRGDVNGSFRSASASPLSAAYLEPGDDLSKKGDDEYKLFVGSMKTLGNSETAYLPLSILSHDEVLAVVLELNYDEAQLEYAATELTQLTQGYQLVVNKSENGSLKIALAGVHGIKNNGEALVIKFNTKSPAKENVRLVEITQAMMNETNNVEIIYRGETGLTAATSLPHAYALSQNYPNPFNPNTTIRFAIPAVKTNNGELVKVRLAIYNINGELVRTLVDDNLAPGHYTVNWNGRDNRGGLVSSGLYCYKLSAEDFSEAKKMLIIE